MWQTPFGEVDVVYSVPRVRGVASAVDSPILSRMASRVGAAQATVLASIEPRTGPAVLSRLRSLAGVEVVHTTSGRFDLLVQVSAATTAELDETLDRIGEARGVLSSESLIHLSTKLDRSGR